MSLKIGSRLGPYEVVSLIGIGGMGEVYQGRDSKLKRDVALKVLPEQFTADHDRLARFQREAEVLASLNHAHIGSIYGVEEADGIQALVLELVDGMTLADRIAEGPLPLHEALPIARQIADALEAAHDHAIVHRDLKPGNIKVRPDGSVKVLDFGLAKSVDVPPGQSDRSPTITIPAPTGMGVVLGTAAYMSPEQARGKSVDKRADIWAFGCVLYEMLTGTRIFDGGEVSDTLALIIMKEPDWVALPPAVPPAARALLRHCLEKNVRHRLRDIADARLAIDDALAELDKDTATTSTRLDTTAGRRGLPWIYVPLVALAAVGLTLLVNQRRNETTSGTPKRLVLQLPESDQLAFGESAPVGEGRPSLAISPDGGQIVYVGRRNDSVQLYQRPLDQLNSTAIPGTEGAFNPFFSPDGRWIGFFTYTHLKKVSVAGGSPVTLCETRNPYGATWMGEFIFFVDRFGNALSRVSAAGGPAETLLARGGRRFWPFAVPEDQVLLLSEWPSGIRLVPVSDRQNQDRVVARTGSSGRLTSTGHLIVVRPGQLLAAPFDRARGETIGPETPVLDGVRTEAWGAGQFSFSQEGTLAYVQGPPATSGTLVFLDRAGGVSSVPGFGTGNYQSFRLAPSGNKLAIIVTEATSELWVYDLARGTRTRLNAAAASGHPLWTPNGEWVVFASLLDGVWNVFRQRGDGSGEAERVLSSANDQIPYWWSPDGRTLAYTEQDPITGTDIWLLSESNRQPQPLLRTPSNETQPAISPDGKWIAYMSDESGKSEVYVTGYPEARGRNLISNDGGEEPIWSLDGKELFYRNGQQWMTVMVEAGATFEASRPRLLFQGNYLNVPGFSYDVTPDNGRFVLIRGVDAPPVREIHLVLNWFEELRSRVPRP